MVARGTGKKLEALPYYKWFWQRFRASRSAQRMGYVARGLYRELLDEQWVKGGIPEDMEQLSLICDCPVEVMQIEWPKIARCFTVKRRGLLANGTLESMRTELDSKRTKSVKAGAKGGTYKALNINAELANAKRSLEPPKTIPTDASDRHIGEKRREEKSKEENKKPFARSVPPEELAGTLPLAGGSDFQVSKSDVDRWTQAFPGVSVKQELKKFKAWCEDNPTKKKTAKGVKSAVFRWLDKAQNRGGGNGIGEQSQKRIEGNAGTEGGEDGPDLYAALYGTVEQGKLN